MIVLKESVWEKIRAQFTEQEKAELNRAIVGMASVCPKSNYVQNALLSKQLRVKLSNAMKVVGASK